MLDALAAESLKMRRHKATWFLVWLFPILFSVVFLIGVGVCLAGLGEPDGTPENLAEWLENTAVIWFVPGNSVGRFIIAAFVAVMFAGEYGWNTWKLIVPHRARSSLIAAKYAIVLIFLALSFALTAAISILGVWAVDTANNEVIPAGITAAALADAHGKAALSALAPILVTVAYASIAAILTRSTIAALVISIVAISIEQLISGFGPLLSMRFPTVIWPLYHALPGYHLANLGDWIGEGKALSVDFPGGDTVAHAWTTSLAVVSAWVAAFVGATFAAFRRQDIN